MWNILSLAALASPKPSLTSLLCRQFSTFTLVYCTSLNAHRQIAMDVDSQDVAHEELNSAYVSIKLWFLLSRKADARSTEMSRKEDLTDNMIWNELWPPFESVVFALRPDAKTGSLSVRMITSILE